LSTNLSKHLKATVFNGDAIRQHINKDLGFSIKDRIEQARRIGWLCDQVTLTGNFAIGDFVCPTEETRAAFEPEFTVFVDRIKFGRFEDTNKLFIAPEKYDVRVTKEQDTVFWVQSILDSLR
jgi:hypothetical protein